jgi:hypothetical protein
MKLCVWLFIVSCGIVMGNSSQDTFLMLRPLAMRDLDESMFTENPFAEEVRTARKERSMPSQEVTEEWRQVLHNLEWKGVLLPRNDFDGLVIGLDRIIRVGEEIVCEGVRVRLTEVKEDLLIWESEDGEKISIELDTFHRRRYAREE